MVTSMWHSWRLGRTSAKWEVGKGVTSLPILGATSSGYHHRQRTGQQCTSAGVGVEAEKRYAMPKKLGPSSRIAQVDEAAESTAASLLR